MNDEEFVRSKFPDAQICWKSRGWHIFVGKPTEVEEAHKVLAGLESLWIGDVVSFDPPLAKPVVDALYLLLRNVNKGWQIDPGEDTRTFW